VAAILDAILNNTFLSHVWNVYPSFFQSFMGPLQGSRVKIRGHMIAHRTPLSPRTISPLTLCCYYRVSGMTGMTCCQSWWVHDHVTMQRWLPHIRTFMSMTLLDHGNLLSTCITSPTTTRNMKNILNGRRLWRSQYIRTTVNFGAVFALSLIYR